MPSRAPKVNAAIIQALIHHLLRRKVTSLAELEVRLAVAVDLGFAVWTARPESFIGACDGGEEGRAAGRSVRGSRLQKLVTEA